MDYRIIKILVISLSILLPDESIRVRQSFTRWSGSSSCTGFAVALSVVSTKRYRKSTLTPWNDETICLGTCIEEEKSQEEDDTTNGILRCTIDIPPSIGNDDDDDDEDMKTDENGYSICIDLPNGAEGSGGLASELWPSGLASSILLSSDEFRSFVNKSSRDDDNDTTKTSKSVVELGSGRGLAGLVACHVGGNCVLTDNDEDAVTLLQSAATINHDRFQQTPFARALDWRDSSEDENTIFQLASDTKIELPVDIVLGSDIAYYWYQLRYIMDTVKNLWGTNKQTPVSIETDSLSKNNLFLVVGQANRESQWDLYKNIRDGCYNQLTDKNESPWEGSTKMFLYNLRMSKFCDTIDDCDKIIDGVVPIAVLIHSRKQDGTLSSEPTHSCGMKPPFHRFAHLATDSDDNNILKSF